jgi:hypothetical protein
MRVWWVIGYDQYYPHPDNFVASFATKDEAKDFIINKNKVDNYDNYRSDFYDIINITDRL